MIANDWISVEGTEIAITISDRMYWWCSAMNWKTIILNSVRKCEAKFLFIPSNCYKQDEAFLLIKTQQTEIENDKIEIH